MTELDRAEQLANDTRVALSTAGGIISVGELASDVATMQLSRGRSRPSPQRIRSHVDAALLQLRADGQAEYVAGKGWRFVRGDESKQRSLF